MPALTARRTACSVNGHLVTFGISTTVLVAGKK
jgi:hypothetical protein